jgi:DNA invertase Pin-like site-specific DNA recombinase
MENKNKTPTAEELDALHDSGADMTAFLDKSTSHRPGLKTQRINVDFPQWMVASLDREAERLGVTRQSVIKVWIATHFDNASSHRESASGTKYSQLEKLIELGLTSAQIAEALGISLPNVRQIKERLETRNTKESV